jgi:hypothetical protein
VPCRVPCRALSISKHAARVVMQGVSGPWNLEFGNCDKVSQFLWRVLILLL